MQVASVNSKAHITNTTTLLTWQKWQSQPTETTSNMEMSQDKHYNALGIAKLPDTIGNTDADKKNSL